MLMMSVMAVVVCLKFLGFVYGVYHDALLRREGVGGFVVRRGVIVGLIAHYKKKI